ncbi:MAG TPA: choice-of-anchor tandem repeat GloVer-containing protein, partial [Terriglobia bacterium]|nr:choice-of-anchor tandem repeat GloVer-containing protein [Terriglobia bacterium]
PPGCGTVFKITLSGTLTTLHSFDYTDGAQPNALIQGTDGDFYGTTINGGAYGYGTVFKISPGGILVTLHDFCDSLCADGAYPNTLVQGTDGNFYGTAQHGGTLHGFSGWGTVFKITADGALTTLYSFGSQSYDGTYPSAPLVQANDGNFYGETPCGGRGGDCYCGCGTLFKITPGGTETTLHKFDATDGVEPQGGLVEDTNGSLYGTTESGGANSLGTVFRLAVGLGSFVEAQPVSGKVGVRVGILGTNLGGATSVTFNGTAATFKVTSSSLISTTVPIGATTGPVQVVTPGGTLTSNVNFRVEP